MEDEAELALLRAGDRAAWARMVRLHHARLVRLARGIAGNRASAEEVVQDAWLAALTGIGGYTGQGRLRAWFSGIVVNKARTRAGRDGRMVSFTDMARSEEAAPPALHPESFLPDGHWAAAPEEWAVPTPERMASNGQAMALLAAAIDALPPAQRTVVLLRDVEGEDAATVCRILEITEVHQRVLLHRARTRLRLALAGPMGEASAAGRGEKP